MWVNLCSEDGRTSTHVVDQYEETSVVYVTHELEEDPVGMQFTTVAKEIGHDAESWTPLAVVQMIDSLTEEIEANAHDREWQFQFLSSEDLTLTAGSTTAELEQAWSGLNSWFQQVHARGVELGVFTHETPAGSARYHQMQRLILSACTVYETLRALIDLLV